MGDDLVSKHHRTEVLATVGLWVSGSNIGPLRLVAGSLFHICKGGEARIHCEYYLYGYCTSSWLFIRIVLFQSHIVLPALPLLWIVSLLQVYVAQRWEFISAGGPAWAVCTPRKVLAAPVLDMPNHLSTLLTHPWFCMTSLFANTNIRLRR